MKVADNPEHERSDGHHRRLRMAELSRIAAALCHEINNPLAVISGNLHPLQSMLEELRPHLEAVAEGLEDAQAREKLARFVSLLPRIIGAIDQGCQRISGVVEGMRMMTSCSREHLGSWCNMGSCVRDALELMQRQTDTAIDLEQGENLWVRGNRLELAQLVLSLISNALEAVSGHTGARVTVRSWHAKGLVWLSVRDNGAGICRRDRERIFQPFFTTKQPGEGYGLGLAQAYNIALAHGGTLDCQCQEGGGCCFTVKLPAAAAQEEMQDVG